MSNSERPKTHAIAVPGSPIRTMQHLTNSIGISIPFYQTLVEHWGAPVGPVLPGKPSPGNPTGRGRKTVWLPDVVAWYLDLAAEQGLEIRHRSIFWGDPTPEFLAWMIEQSETSMTTDDGGE